MGKFLDPKIENAFSKMFKNRETKHGSTQSHIPIEYIKNGILKLKQGNEYRVILKVDAINFFTKSDDEKVAIVNQFGVFLNSMKIPIQIVSQSKTLNMKNAINALKDKFNKADNPNLKEYIAIYAQLLDGLSASGNVLTKDFYLVLKYTAKDGEAFLTVEKNIRNVYERTIRALKNCGLDSILLDDAEIYQLLYLFYNKDKSRIQSLDSNNINRYMTTALSLKKENEGSQYGNFFEKDSFIGGSSSKQPKPDANYNPNTPINTPTISAGMISAEDILAADDIEIHKDYLIINSRYVRNIFISGIMGEECYIEWLNSIYSYAANIDISLHITPVNKKSAIDDLTKKYTHTLATLYETQGRGKVLSEIEKNDVSELDYLRKIISTSQELFYLSFYLSISADSLEELDDLTLNIESEFGGKQILTRRAALTQLNAFNSILPIGLDTIKYYRNIPTEALSTFFPFTNSELSCTNGEPILYGRNLLTGSLIIFDKFIPPDASITNFNSIICGASGSGKSFSTKLEIMRSFVAGKKIIGIDPNSEYLKLTNRVGGQYIKIGGGSKDKLNIFDISYYEEEDGTIPNLLQDKIGNLHSIFKMMFELKDAPYSAQMSNIIERAIEAVYAEKGINKNPASLFVGDKIIRGNLNLSNSYFKEFPTLTDFKHVLYRFGEAGRHIADVILYSFIDGAYNLFNGQTTVDTSNRMIFFDIKDCPQNLQSLMYLVLCEFIWEKVKRKPRREQQLFVADESWIMMKNEYTARFLAEFARQCRKFNVGLACITQQAEDFFRDPWGYGKVIYANTAMHVLMRQTKEDIKIIAETYKLEDHIKNDLLNSQQGYGYIFWGANYTKIYFSYAQGEFDIVNTNANATR